jgi:hypothetical protein
MVAAPPTVAAIHRSISFRRSVDTHRQQSIVKD